MFGNKYDPIEVPIDLCCRKADLAGEEPLQLVRAKATRRPTHEPSPLDVERTHEPSSPLDVEISLWSESCFYAGLNGNASQAGLFVATYRPLRCGERLLLRFELFGERIEIEGEVQWRRGASEHASPGVGVAFHDLSSSARALIDAFCATRAPLYYEVENDARPS
jgi:uncharacterized protein (TIGR02266 family)